MFFCDKHLAYLYKYTQTDPLTCSCLQLYVRSCHLVRSERYDTMEACSGGDEELLCERFQWARHILYTFK